MRSNRPSGRFAAATAVLIVHGLLILLFLRADRGTKANPPQEIVRTGILYLLSLSRQRPQARSPTRAAPRRRRGKSLTPTVAHAPAVAMPPEAPNISVSNRSKLDWHETADEVARSLTSRHGTKVHPGSGEHPPSPYGDCEPRPQFAWDPEPKRVGLIDHWLPYLRLGDHCIVSLGFFGCVVGQLPGANGRLFERVVGGKAAQDPTPTLRTWPDGEPRGLCRPSP
ncbi:MAG: hypothetical protein ACREV7_03260 [Steroidobacteraceae bacterium]